ncbi:hypothetical protein ILYODFUR_033343, partial [Ilyodon furcidens]
CLLVCWLPYISVCLYETLSGQPSQGVTAALSTWLVLTSAALNPWIICMTQNRYRSAVHRSFGRFYQRCSGMFLQLHFQNTVVHLNTANPTTATTTATETSRSVQPAAPRAQ